MSVESSVVLTSAWKQQISPWPLYARLYAALPPAGVGAASPQACPFQFVFGAEVKQKDLSWKIF